MKIEPRPTQELIAELRKIAGCGSFVVGNDSDPATAAARQLEAILKAWEAFRYSSRPDEYQALERAITGTSTEGRG